MVDIESNRHNWTFPPMVSKPRTDHTSDLTVVDLFSGPGGISEGFKQSGFTPVFGVDIHEPAIETYKSNNPTAGTILGDISYTTGSQSDTRGFIQVLEEGIQQETVLEKVYNKLSGSTPTVVTGGVPCQGFSLANKKQTDEDERNYLFQEFIRGVSILSPEFILLENVSAMKQAKDGDFVTAIVTALEKLGYTVEYMVVNASEYGVPQDRNRLFFLGSKSNSTITFPQPTQKESVSAFEAINDLSDLSVGETDSTYNTPPQNWYQNQLRSTDSYTNHSAPNHQTKTVTRIQNTEPGEPMYDNFTQRIRLPIDDVSPTIVAGGIRPQFQFGHPTQTRGLTVRERARLQSFPDTFTFETGLTQGRVLTGMAVPPLLAKAFADHIKNNLL